jgi:hypothetical protein
LIGVPRRRVFARDADLFQQLSTSFAEGRHDTLSLSGRNSADLGHRHHGPPSPPTPLAYSTAATSIRPSCC